jgi:uncharacterized membrane protein
VRAARKPFREDLRYSILFSWIAIPMVILLFFNPTLGLWPHHVVMFFPANFLILAVLFDFAVTRKPRPTLMFNRKSRDWSRVARTCSILILLSIILAQIAFGFGFLRLLSIQGGTSGDYEVGIQYKTEIARFIAQNSNGSSFTISHNLTPGEIGTEYSYLLNLYNKTASDSANTSYVVINTLSTADSSLVLQLAGYPKFTFGPLTLYVIRR